MTERKPFILSDLYEGNLDLIKEPFSNPETIIFYDIDGILADSPKVVYEKFKEENNIDIKPSQTDSWNYLNKVAHENGIPFEKIIYIQDDWYNPDVLFKAQPYLYIRPVVEKTLKLFTPERNFILTARNPNLKSSTINWINLKYPKILTNNILIREDKNMDSSKYKMNEILPRAKNAPWVIFIEDTPEYIKSLLDLKIDNLVVINIPIGQRKPDFKDPRMIVVKRYPEDIQAMYPLMYLINSVLKN